MNDLWRFPVIIVIVFYWCWPFNVTVWPTGGCGYFAGCHDISSCTYDGLCCRGNPYDGRHSIKYENHSTLPNITALISVSRLLRTHMMVRSLDMIRAFSVLLTFCAERLAMKQLHQTDDQICKTLMSTLLCAETICSLTIDCPLKLDW